MKSLSNFLFYISLFTQNTFIKNWKWMIGSSLIVGTLLQFYQVSIWPYIGSLFGCYLASMHTEYKEHKAAVIKKNRDKKYNEVIEGLKHREAEFFKALVYILDDEEVALGYVAWFENIAKDYYND